MRRTIIVLGIIGLLGFITFRTLFGGATISWHQRLTVTIGTPMGEVSGASVTKITNTDTRGLLVVPDASGVHSSVRGEAVAVEVEPGRWLFALLSGDDVNYKGQADQLARYAFRLGQDRAVLDRSYESDMAELMAQPLNSPAPVPRDAYPMFVTFDDITKPETVRLVDPDDLDAAFGCARDAVQSNHPWRVAGVTYREWVASEVVRLSREMASEKSGLTGPVGDAITELHFITDDHNYNAADELRMTELRTHFSEKQLRVWRDARYTLEQELPATLATPQSVSANTGGPCHQLTSVTLEITRDALTVGRVEGVVGWLDDPHYITNPGWAALPNLTQDVFMGLRSPLQPFEG